MTVLNKAIIVLGFIILIVGGGLAFYNIEIKIPTGHGYYNQNGVWIPYHETIYVHPYWVAGLIVALVGFVTMYIGGALPDKEEQKKKERKTEKGYTIKDALKGAFGEE